MLIKLLCTQEWTRAEMSQSGKSGAKETFWIIDGVRQWSMGAGHNATCPECIKIYSEKVARVNYKMVLKLQKLVPPPIPEDAKL